MSGPRRGMAAAGVRHESATIVVVPSLADVVAQPDLVAQLPLEVCERLMVETATLQAQLLARIARAGAVASSSGTELLDVKTAAKLFGLAPDTLYRKVRRDPIYRAMTVDTGTDRVVFDPRKLNAFVARRVR